MNRLPGFAVACMLIALLAGCTAAPSVPPVPTTVGIVVSVQGSPAVTRKNREYILGAQSRVYEGDILKTDRFSATRIDMTDGTRIDLGRDTRLVVHEFRPAGARLNLGRGAIHCRSGPDSELPMEVQTPVAIIRARGADFVGGFASSNTLNVGLLGGNTISVSNIHGSVEVHESGAGTTVIGGTAPQASRPWTPGKIERTMSAMEIEP